MSDSFAGDIGRGVIGAGLGFALVLFLTGKGWGLGGRGGTREPSPSPGVETLPAPPVPPSRPQDPEPLVFRISSKGLELIDPRGPLPQPGTTGRVWTLDEIVLRVKEGGRKDITLRLTGGANQGLVDEADARFKLEGFKVGIQDVSEAAARAAVEASKAKVSGRGHYARLVRRGYYGRGYYRNLY